MKLLRSAVVLAALFIGSQAHATVTSVSFKGALDWVTPDLGGLYAVGQTFTGQFTFDDHKAPVGWVQIGGNTISFKEGDTFMNDSGFDTSLFHHAHPGKVGGTVSDTLGTGIDGVALGLSFQPGLGPYAKVADVLKLPLFRPGTFSLEYDGQGSAHGIVNELAQIDPAAVPEPASMLLLGLGLGGIVAGRRYGRQQAVAQA